MLKIERYGNGFRVRSSPRNLDIRARNVREIGQVVRHYYGHCSRSVRSCIVCRQIDKRRAKR